MTKLSYLVAALVLTALTVATPSWAFKVRRSGSLGDQKSGSTALMPTPPGTDNAPVVSAATPPSHALPGKVFVITDVCWFLTGANDTVTVKANGATLLLFGPSASGGAGVSQCEHFESGFVVGTGQDVTCDARANVEGYGCSITGYVTNE